MKNRIQPFILVINLSLYVYTLKSNQKIELPVEKNANSRKYFIFVKTK